MFLKFSSPHLAAKSEPIVVKRLGRVLPDGKGHWTDTGILEIDAPFWSRCVLSLPHPMSLSNSWFFRLLTSLMQRLPFSVILNAFSTTLTCMANCYPGKGDHHLMLCYRSTDHCTFNAHLVLLWIQFSPSFVLFFIRSNIPQHSEELSTRLDNNSRTKIKYWEQISNA